MRIIFRDKNPLLTREIRDDRRETAAEILDRAMRSGGPEKIKRLQAAKDELNVLSQSKPVPPAQAPTEFKDIARSAAAWLYSFDQGILVNDAKRSVLLTEMAKTTRVKVGVEGVIGIELIDFYLSLHIDRPEKETVEHAKVREAFEKIKDALARKTANFIAVSEMSGYLKTKADYAQTQREMRVNPSKALERDLVYFKEELEKFETARLPQGLTARLDGLKIDGKPINYLSLDDEKIGSIMVQVLKVLNQEAGVEDVSLMDVFSVLDKIAQANVERIRFAKKGQDIYIGSNVIASALRTFFSATTRFLSGPDVEELAKAKQERRFTSEERLAIEQKIINHERLAFEDIAAAMTLRKEAEANHARAGVDKKFETGQALRQAAFIHSQKQLASVMVDSEIPGRAARVIDRLNPKINAVQRDVDQWLQNPDARLGERTLRASLRNLSYHAPVTEDVETYYDQWVSDGISHMIRRVYLPESVTTEEIQGGVLHSQQSIVSVFEGYATSSRVEVTGKTPADRQTGQTVTLQNQVRRQLTDRAYVEHNLRLAGVTTDWGTKLIDDSTQLESGLTVTVDMGNYELLFPVDVAYDPRRGVTMSLGTGLRTDNGVRVEAGVIYDGQKQAMNPWFDVEYFTKKANVGLSMNGDQLSTQTSLRPNDLLILNGQATYDTETGRESGQVGFVVNPQGKLSFTGNVNEEFHPVFGVNYSAVETGTQARLTAGEDRVQADFRQKIGRVLEVSSGIGYTGDRGFFSDDVFLAYRDLQNIVGVDLSIPTTGDRNLGLGFGLHRGPFNGFLRYSTDNALSASFTLGLKNNAGAGDVGLGLQSRFLTNPVGISGPVPALSADALSVGEFTRQYLEGLKENLARGERESLLSREMPNLDLLLSKWNEMAGKLSEARAKGEITRSQWAVLSLEMRRAQSILDEVERVLDQIQSAAGKEAEVQAWARAAAAYRADFDRLEEKIKEMVAAQDAQFAAFRAVSDAAEKKVGEVAAESGNALRGLRDDLDKSVRGWQEFYPRVAQEAERFALVVRAASDKWKNLSEADKTKHEAAINALAGVLRNRHAFSYVRTENVAEESRHWAALVVAGGLNPMDIEDQISVWDRLSRALAEYADAGDLDAKLFDGKAVDALRTWAAAAFYKGGKTLGTEWVLAELKVRQDLKVSFEKFYGHRFDSSSADDTKRLALLSGLVTYAGRRVDDVVGSVDFLGRVRVDLEGLIGGKDPSNVDAGLGDWLALMEWSEHLKIWSRSGIDPKVFLQAMRLLRTPLYDALKNYGMIRDEAEFNAQLSDPLSFVSGVLEGFVAEAKESGVLPAQGFSREFMKSYLDVHASPEYAQRIRALLDGETMVEAPAVYLGVLVAMQKEWQAIGRAHIRGNEFKALEAMKRVKDALKNNPAAANLWFDGALNLKNPDHLNKLLYYALYEVGIGEYRVETGGIELTNIETAIAAEVKQLLGAPRLDWTQDHGTVSYWSSMAAKINSEPGRAGQGVARVQAALRILANAQAQERLTALSSSQGRITTQDLRDGRAVVGSAVGFVASMALYKGLDETQMLARLDIAVKAHDHLYNVFGIGGGGPPADITNPSYARYLMALVEAEIAGRIPSAETLAANMESIARRGFSQKLFGKESLTSNDILDASGQQTPAVALLESVALLGSLSESNIQSKTGPSFRTFDTDRLTENLVALTSAGVDWSWAGIDRVDISNPTHRGLLLHFAVMAEQELNSKRVGIDAVKHLLGFMAQTKGDFEKLLGRGENPFAQLADARSADFIQFVGQAQSLYQIYSAEAIHRAVAVREKLGDKLTIADADSRRLIFERLDDETVPGWDSLKQLDEMARLGDVNTLGLPTPAFIEQMAFISNEAQRSGLDSRFKDPQFTSKVMANMGKLYRSGDFSWYLKGAPSLSLDNAEHLAMLRRFAVLAALVGELPEYQDAKFNGGVEPTLEILKKMAELYPSMAGKENDPEFTLLLNRAALESGFLGDAKDLSKVFEGWSIDSREFAQAMADIAPVFDRKISELKLAFTKPAVVDVNSKEFIESPYGVALHLLAEIKVKNKLPIEDVAKILDQMTLASTFEHSIAAAAAIQITGATQADVAEVKAMMANPDFQYVFNQANAAWQPDAYRFLFEIAVKSIGPGREIYDTPWDSVDQYLAIDVRIVRQLLETKRADVASILLDPLLFNAALPEKNLYYRDASESAQKAAAALFEIALMAERTEIPAANVDNDHDAKIKLEAALTAEQVIENLKIQKAIAQKTSILAFTQRNNSYVGTAGYGDKVKENDRFNATLGAKRIRQVYFDLAEQVRRNGVMRLDYSKVVKGGQEKVEQKYTFVHSPAGQTITVDGLTAELTAIQSYLNSGRVLSLKSGYPWVEGVTYYGNSEYSPYLRQLVSDEVAKRSKAAVSAAVVQASAIDPAVLLGNFMDAFGGLPADQKTTVTTLFTNNFQVNLSDGLSDTERDSLITSGLADKLNSLLDIEAKLNIDESATGNNLSDTQRGQVLGDFARTLALGEIKQSTVAGFAFVRVAVSDTNQYLNTRIATATPEFRQVYRFLGNAAIDPTVSIIAGRYSQESSISDPEKKGAVKGDLAYQFLLAHPGSPVQTEVNTWVSDRNNAQAAMFNLDSALTPSRADFANVFGIAAGSQTLSNAAYVNTLFDIVTDN
ncbi:MAG: hypothetical protein HYZ87_00395, partial [Candidatus Omnitrophica bacterium]|nr:hypothetical protein [Candidatus Omnitrophota bacterium]